jgi:hypothetical protein
MFTPCRDKGTPFFTTIIENRDPLSYQEVSREGEGRRVRISNSGDRRTLRKSKAPNTAQVHVTDR